MPRRVGDILAQRATTSMVGREGELEALLGLLEDDSALVMHVHGIAGVGKSTLLSAFARQAEARGATVVGLDCRLVEPTERGTLQGLTETIGSHELTVGGVADGLGSLGNRVVLTLDTYEVFRLMDTWLRQIFVPQLSDNVRLVLAGREPPVASWRIAPEWQGLFRAITLEPLEEGDALELLSQAGLSDDQARRINRQTRGHPLALRLAASAALERPGLDLERGTVQGVVEELAHLFLADVKDSETREGLEAASVVRRITQSLLEAMLPKSDPHAVYDRLSELPFVESRRDGLRLLDSVHDALAEVLHAADPSRCLDYRRRAWQQRGHCRLQQPGTGDGRRQWPDEAGHRRSWRGGLLYDDERRIRLAAGHEHGVASCCRRGRAALVGRPRVGRRYRLDRAGVDQGRRPRTGIILRRGAGRGIA